MNKCFYPPCPRVNKSGQSGWSRGLCAGHAKLLNVAVRLGAVTDEEVTNAGVHSELAWVRKKNGKKTDMDGFVEWVSEKIGREVGSTKPNNTSVKYKIQVGNVSIETDDLKSAATALFALAKQDKPVETSVATPVVVRKHKKHQHIKACPECGIACRGPKGLGIHRKKTHNVIGKREAYNESVKLRKENEMDAALSKVNGIFVEEPIQ